VFCSSHGTISASHDAICSSHDVICSLQNESFSLHVTSCDGNGAFWDAIDSVCEAPGGRWALFHATSEPRLPIGG